MPLIAYNLSEKLQTYLNKIESVRAEILLTPLSTKTELQCRWEANLARVFWGLSILDSPVTKKDIVNLLSHPIHSRLSETEKLILTQYSAFYFIKEHYYVTPSPVNLVVIKRIYAILNHYPPLKSVPTTQFLEAQLAEVVNYLAAGNDHPVIKAGIAQIKIASLAPFAAENARLSRMISYLYLYCAGYDFRGLLVMEEFLKNDLAIYRKISDRTKNSDNLTYWLEYYCQAMLVQLSKMAEQLKKTRFGDKLAPYLKINERQKQILGALENPTARITNKQVQKMFGVSQITASRDLSKLTSVELLFSHGRGRSVYYTKV